jgi:3-hydroxyacyl-[acyl-carrier-protein] dehydratase
LIFMSMSVLDNLPHRKPFRFVSSVVELDAGRRGVGLWSLSGDEDFFGGHFPGNPVVPGVLLAEALAQVSGLVAFGGDGASGIAQGGEPDGTPSRAGRGPARLAQVSVKFQAGVVPPAEVRLESVLTKEMGGLYLFDVRADVGGVVAASGTLVLARQDGTRRET